MIINLVLFFITLLLLTGLCLDVGLAELFKMRLQHAADAGAMGAALESARGTGNCNNGAISDAALNGFTNGSSGVTVTVNTPPLSGSYSSDSSAYEVIVCANYHPAFLFLVGASAQKSCARAVARNTSTPLISTIFGDMTQGTQFTDSVQTAVENNQPLTGAVVHGGWANDALQGQNSQGSLTYHGGPGGNVYTLSWGSSQYITRFYGIYLVGSPWYGDVIGQISFVTNTGTTYGPYGTAFGGGTVVDFDYTVPTGAKVYGFVGSADALVHAVGVIYGYTFSASLAE